MKYYLDTEFTRFGGELLSLALVREDGESIYIIIDYGDANLEMHPWVRENVIPILHNAPKPALHLKPDEIGQALRTWLAFDETPPIIHADWPSDISYVCEALITGPGQMVDITELTFKLVRAEPYPTALDGAVQHNAWWDAMALREALTPRPRFYP